MILIETTYYVYFNGTQQPNAAFNSEKKANEYIEKNKYQFFNPNDIWEVKTTR
jgi:hypothetical protein